MCGLSARSGNRLGTYEVPIAVLINSSRPRSRPSYCSSPFRGNPQLTSPPTYEADNCSTTWLGKMRSRASTNPGDGFLLQLAIVNPRFLITFLYFMRAYFLLLFVLAFSAGSVSIAATSRFHTKAIWFAAFSTRTDTPAKGDFRLQTSWSTPSSLKPQKAASWSASGWNLTLGARV
jgi:hypothetical protein